MVQQHMFVAFLTFYMYRTSDIHWRSFVWREKAENVIMVFNHACYVFQPSIAQKEKLHNE